MTRFIILMAIIGIALIVWHKIKKAKGEERKKMVFWSVLSGVGAVVALLAVTGHLNIITAAIAGMVALAPKIMRFAQYLPFVNRLYQQHNQPHQQQAQTPTPGKKTMSADEAREVLGLKPGSTKEEIILAHRRMMQKMHPDRGGSDFMAAQINKAKETLLG
ncbi:hypothetical protein JYT79_00710 [Cardiobacterium sp. AH-315-I02]|nr:hypothetical protein [Cardiobacterium sp. AH-315-I02]